MNNYLKDMSNRIRSDSQGPHQPSCSFYEGPHQSQNLQPSNEAGHKQSGEFFNLVVSNINDKLNDLKSHQTSIQSLI